MNIIHLIEKIPFLELEFIEHAGLPYMILLYLIDVFCTRRLCKSFEEATWTSYIPFYNWVVVFRHCWNLKAFYEHLLLEVLGLAIPIICEHIVFLEWLESIFSLIDIAVACLATKHVLEIGRFTLLAYGYDAKKYFAAIFFFDAVLILAVKGHYEGNRSLAETA
jgi:hypothetical protein